MRNSETVPPKKAAGERSRNILKSDRKREAKIKNAGSDIPTKREAELVAFRELGYSFSGCAKMLDERENKTKDILREVANKRTIFLEDIYTEIKGHRAIIIAHAELSRPVWEIASELKRKDHLDRLKKEYRDESADGAVRKELEKISEFTDYFDGIMTAMDSDEVIQRDTPFVSRYLIE